MFVIIYSYYLLFTFLYVFYFYLMTFVRFICIYIYVYSYTCIYIYINVVLQESMMQNMREIYLYIVVYQYVNGCVVKTVHGTLRLLGLLYAYVSSPRLLLVVDAQHAYSTHTTCTFGSMLFLLCAEFVVLCHLYQCVLDEGSLLSKYLICFSYIFYIYIYVCIYIICIHVYIFVSLFISFVDFYCNTHCFFCYFVCYMFVSFHCLLIFCQYCQLCFYYYGVTSLF